MAALTALLGACTTIEYGPLGGKPTARFAYEEKPDGDSRYILKIVATGGGDMQTIQSMWDRRARELCGTSNYRKTIFRAERATVLYDLYGGMPGMPVLEGFLDCTAPSDGA